MPQPIQNPVVGQILQRQFNLVGRVRPFLDEIIVPVVSLGELNPGAPPPVLGRATAAFSEAAVAAERFVFRFETPGNVLAVIRRIYLLGSVAGNLTARFSGNAAIQGALASTADKSFADGRVLAGSGLAETPASVLTTGTNAGSPFGPADLTIQYRVPTDGVFIDIPDPGWPIGTGTPGIFGFLEGQIAVNNNTVIGHFEWDEYRLV